MKCIVTAGPTWEPLDRVRRLTNFSTGRLGAGLADYLAGAGHQVTLLLGESATCPSPRSAVSTERFSQTDDLAKRLARLAGAAVDAVFHAAAVSDFRCGGVWRRRPDGGLEAVTAGKIATRDGPVLVELLPTPKLLVQLRDWYPRACLVGWKYEVDGSREDALAQGVAQLRANRTDACVVNGPAFGEGYGVVRFGGAMERFAEARGLYAALERLAAEPRG